MSGLEIAAAELLRCALAHAPGARLVGNVTAIDVARVAARCCSSCPACGAEPWVNIDCSVCAVLAPIETERPKAAPRERGHTEDCRCWQCKR